MLETPPALSCLHRVRMQINLFSLFTTKTFKNMNNHRSIQDAFIVIMRITLTQILMMAILSTLVSAASLNGQGILDRKVSINVSNTEVKLILAEIEKQASVVFTYRPSHVKSSRKISFKAEDATIGGCFDSAFQSGDFIHCQWMIRRRSY